MTLTNLKRELITIGYLNGKSFDEIASENETAKGTVFNIINNWLDQIGVPDIKVLREFSVNIRKSGITIKECAQGYRFIQILDSFGIKDEPDPISIDSEEQTNTIKVESASKSKNKKNNRWYKNHISTSRDNFYYFIEVVYNYCKNQNISQTNIIEWIEDLIDISPLLNNSKGNYRSRSEENPNQFDIQQNLNTDLSNNNFHKKHKNAKEEIKFEIPLISNINGHIEQTKLMIRNLETNKKRLQQETIVLEKQESILNARIANLKREEESSLTYLDWYNNLKKDLLHHYNIVLDEEISSFVNVCNDFKYYDYETHQIVKEYKEIESLRSEKEGLEGIIKSSQDSRNELSQKIESLQEREKYSRKSLDVLLSLYHAGFDFDELEKLKDIVIEICQANGITFYDAGKKFLKDVQNQYDRKLGFETKINETKLELKNLEMQEPKFREYLQSEVIINKSLPFLYRYSVTDDDIINMTNVVNAYLRGELIFNPNLRSKNLTIVNNVTGMPEYWKLFINEIRILGDINSQIIKQQSHLEATRKEIDNLNLLRQKLNEQTLLLSQLLDTLSGRLPDISEFIKQIIFSAKNINKISIVFQPLFFIHVDTGSYSKDDNNITKDE